MQEWNVYSADTPRDQGKCPLNRSGAFIKHKAVLPAISSCIRNFHPLKRVGGGGGGCLLEGGSLFERGVNNGGLISTALQCSVVQSNLSNTDNEGTERSVRKIYARQQNRGNIWKASRKRDSWARFNVYVYAWPSLDSPLSLSYLRA